MTNEEAIGMAIRCCENIRRTSATNHITASMDIAIDALEKQIPKKPISEIITICELYEDYVEYYCPNCNSYLTSCCEEEYTDYCDECGQRIDWGEENDE